MPSLPRELLEQREAAFLLCVVLRLASHLVSRVFSPLFLFQVPSPPLPRSAPRSRLCICDLASRIDLNVANEQPRSHLIKIALPLAQPCPMHCQPLLEPAREMVRAMVRAWLPQSQGGQPMEKSSGEELLRARTLPWLLPRAMVQTGSRLLQRMGPLQQSSPASALLLASAPRLLPPPSPRLSPRAKPLVTLAPPSTHHRHHSLGWMLRQSCYNNQEETKAAGRCQLLLPLLLLYSAPRLTPLLLLLRRRHQASWRASPLPSPPPAQAPSPAPSLF